MIWKYSPHNMIVIDKVSLDLFNISYVVYKDGDIIQYVKYGLSAYEIAQLFGNN
jgi:hypothetical protein